MIKDISPKQPPPLIREQKPPFERSPQEKQINLYSSRDTHAPIEAHQLITFV